MNKKSEFTPAELTILARLQQDARLSSADLAADLNLSVTPTWRRIKNLEESGVIRAYRADLSPHELGYRVEAYVTVNVASHDERNYQLFEAAVLSCKYIVSCHVISGSSDYLLRVFSADLETYADFVTHYASRLPGVKGIRSSLVLKTLKEFTGYPLPSVAGSSEP